MYLDLMINKEFDKQLSELIKKQDIDFDDDEDYEEINSLDDIKKFNGKNKNFFLEKATEEEIEKFWNEEL